jgi:hypothetical protein
LGITKKLLRLELSHKDLSFYELTQLLKGDYLMLYLYLKSAVKKLKGVENVDEKIYYEFSQLQVEIEKCCSSCNRGNRDIFTNRIFKAHNNENKAFFPQMRGLMRI